jgi:SLOG family YspA-like protein
VRVIVCGSRNWTDKDTVWRELDVLLAGCAFPGLALSFAVVHGDCPTGADHFAELWCNRNGIKQERFPAEWRKTGSDKVDYSAGPKRDKKMAEAGANLCLAFWDGRWRMRRGKLGKPGTLTMVEYALQYGISVRIVPPRKA